MDSLLAVLLVQLIELLSLTDVLTLAIAFIVLGAVALGAFLWLANFPTGALRFSLERGRLSAQGLVLQCKYWLRAGVTSIWGYLYLWLVLDLVPALWKWWRTDFIARLGEFSILWQLALLMLPMGLLFAALFPILFWFPIYDWLDVFSVALQRVFRTPRMQSMSGSQSVSAEERTSLDGVGGASAEDSDYVALIQWPNRRWLAFGTFLAFVLGILLWAFSYKGPIVFLAIAATQMIVPTLPSTFVERTHYKFRRWMISVVWLYYWFTAGVGWQYGWWGLFFITLPALLVAGGGLFFISGFLLPFPDLDLYRGKRAPRVPGSIPIFREEVRDFIDLFRYSQNKEARREWIERRRNVLRCLVTYTLGTNYPYWVVVDEKITERTEEERAWLTAEDRIVKRVDGDLFGGFLCGPGIVLTGCDHAAVIHSSIRHKGARGPGVIFTGYGEGPQQALDLRVQLRAFPVQAWTKDGIAVKVVTFVPFQIGTGRRVPTLGEGFPYRVSEAFKAFRSQLMEHKDLSQAPGNMDEVGWYDLPQMAARRILERIIARYNFTQIYTPYGVPSGFEVDIRKQIVQQLAEELDRVLPDFGIQRIGCGISNIMPVDEERVIDQHIDTWKANWVRKIMRKQAIGQSARLRIVEQARAQAQVEIIMEIGDRIQQLRGVGIEELAIRLIEILEGQIRSAAVRQFLPEDALRIVGMARSRVEGRETKG